VPRVGRVCLLITGLEQGGAETQVLHLAAGLQDRGWCVRVISMRPPGGLAPRFVEAGVAVDSLNMHRGIPDPWAAVRLRSRLREAAPDVLHSHMVHANLLARASRLLYDVPVLVSTVHSVQEGSRWRTLAIRATDSLCDVTTVVSDAVGERYRESRLAPSHKLRRLPNGIDTDRFHPDDSVRAVVRRELGLDGRFVWLAVGRFVPAKDYPSLLRAFSSVARCVPEATLLIAGEGPLLGECKALVEREGLAEVVRFLGVRRDVPRLMNAADAYVMSSAWEGLPMVLLEAAATGLPIVATDVGGNGEIVVEGRTGTLIAERDVGALADAMTRLMTLPGTQRRRMGVSARDHVLRGFSLPGVIDRWERLYRELLEGAQT
jgi:glycosyltransferase involved in cell wall biosynthesis